MSFSTVVAADPSRLFFCASHQRNDARLLDVVTHKTMCPLCVVLEGINISEPRFFYIGFDGGNTVARLLRMRRDPNGSMNLAADYVVQHVLRKQLFMRGETLAALPPPIIPATPREAPATADESRLMLVFPTALWRNTSGITEEDMILSARTIARHALTAPVPARAFKNAFSVVTYLTDSLEAVRDKEAYRLKRNMVRAIAAVARAAGTPAVKSMLQQAFMSAFFPLLSVPLEADGGRTVAAVADVLLMLAPEVTVKSLLVRPEQVLGPLRQLARASGVAPGTAAIAANALEAFQTEAPGTGSATLSFLRRRNAEIYEEI